MKRLIEKAFKIARERNWKKIYIACDIHDVILEANYSKDIPTKFLGNAKKVLQRLSQRSDVTLILYTCSHPSEIEQYLKLFTDAGINFSYVNENPECVNTAYGDFTVKFYFNILLEDKAGFVPEDWDEIDEALNTQDLIA